MLRKKWSIFTFTLVLGVVLNLAGCSATSTDENTSKPSLAARSITVIKAQVIEIDYDNRFVTLLGEGGQSVRLHVDESVTNFNKTRVGDQLEVDYLESIAVYVQKSGEEVPSMSESGGLSLAARGDKPGLLATDTVHIVAKVLAVDLKARTVILRGPDNINRKLPVDDSVEGLENVNVGDEVVARYTMALAISVAAQ